MLKYGIIGYFEHTEERCVVWSLKIDDISSYSLSAIANELRLFIKEIHLYPSNASFEDIVYYFSEDGKKYTLKATDECFCFMFSTGRLTRVPVMDVYKDFIRAI